MIMMTTTAMMMMMMMIMIMMMERGGDIQFQREKVVQFQELCAIFLYQFSLVIK